MLLHVSPDRFVSDYAVFLLPGLNHLIYFLLHPKVFLWALCNAGGRGCIGHKFYASGSSIYKGKTLLMVPF